MFVDERIGLLELVRDKITGLKEVYHPGIYHEGLDLAVDEVQKMIEDAQKRWPSGMGPTYMEKDNDV